MYNVGSTDMLKAFGVAVIGGLGMGVIWATVGTWFSYGFLLILVGAALGWAFTRMMDFGTRGKRGPYIVAFAIAGILIAWGMQWFVVDPFVARLELLAVAVGAYFCYQSLR
jgi:hypothetical protein